MRTVSILTITVLFLAAFSAYAYADNIAILRQGMLGAGTGAIATAVTGAKGDHIWQGALIGAGVNVVGGALLDIITGERAGTINYIQPSQPVMYVQQPAPVVVYQPVRRQRVNSAQRRIYRQGFRDGYNRGYEDGYADARYDMYGY